LVVNQQIFLILVVEQEWLKLAGDQGPEMLKAVKGAVEKYRSFTGK